VTRRNNVQLGIPDEAITDLTVLAAKIGRKVGKPRMTRAQVAMKALYHILSVDFDEALRIFEAGQRKEVEYEPVAETETDCPASTDAPEPGSGPVFRGRHTKGGAAQPIPGKRNGIPKGRANKHGPVLKIND
jgi:hypothetical protein